MDEVGEQLRDVNLSLVSCTSVAEPLIESTHRDGLSPVHVPGVIRIVRPVFRSIKST